MPNDCIQAFNIRALELTNKHRKDHNVPILETDFELTLRAENYSGHLCNICIEVFKQEITPANVNIALLVDTSMNSIKFENLSAEYCASKFLVCD